MQALNELQQEIETWAYRNFGPQDATWPLLGLVEELGELSHAHLKERQRIRGNPEDHQAAARDALGDLLIFACHYSATRGWKLGDVLSETWESVKSRDWKSNPRAGM